MQTTTNTTKLRPGDRIRMRYGPYVIEATVRAVGPRGAVLRLPDVAALDPDSNHPIDAPDGVRLSDGGRETFLGSAHFAAAERVTQ